jgi:hypothetical protein
MRSTPAHFKADCAPLENTGNGRFCALIAADLLTNNGG